MLYLNSQDKLADADYIDTRIVLYHIVDNPGCLRRLQTPLLPRYGPATGDQSHKDQLDRPTIRDHVLGNWENICRLLGHADYGQEYLAEIVPHMGRDDWQFRFLPDNYHPHLLSVHAGVSTLESCVGSEWRGALLAVV